MKRWSTKDLYTLTPPADGRPGDGILTFTDRYSVYDFGVMPDEIPGKGKASCAMAITSFGLMHDAGIATHFVEQVSDNAIRIKLLDIDLEGRRELTGPGGMIPLQVVYRNALPKESSVHRRVAAGRLDPALIPDARRPGSPWLDEVMVEFTTKFEETDRFVTREEAAAVGRVGLKDITRIEQLTQRLGPVLTAHCEAAGMRLVDGKAEYGFDADGELIVIDHAGTPDENRFYLDGVPVCKELLRCLHPGLRELVQRHVEDGLPRDRWARPEPLGGAAVEATSEVYAALSAVWTGPSTSATQDLSAAVRNFVEVTGAVLGDRTGL
ncbi:phosphoribosylaminoimidazolesuccinocarboxamide synthase [Streptomyces salyersiae]|uniref:Phosphoribosylaminoimidazole-succinocarboxamide synthase n=1 Tax=Streptomyces salyersiae TaxID=3075530 RepID=A0ABU2RGD7_9ACTN|nr:phosphoribosylaminoimidazolesuccinocarboxamide synthase [Streptomyces sp. DSM 41770]MDT0427338.1 phosphoribosylaminoimidazolesuccinocarboxamide synthase [Streptomyces sp. DSM 41770]